MDEKFLTALSLLTTKTPAGCVLVTEAMSSAPSYRVTETVTTHTNLLGNVVENVTVCCCCFFVFLQNQNNDLPK